VTAILVRRYDPAIGAERDLWITKRDGRVVVRRKPPQNGPDAQTIRLAEARLAFAEGARRARGARGFVGDLPASSVVTGETAHELMQQASGPRLNAERARRQYYAALVGPEVLERAAEILGAPRPSPLPSAVQLRVEMETPGVTGRRTGFGAIPPEGMGPPPGIVSVRRSGARARRELSAAD
jgi:hypothetical protein